MQVWRAVPKQCANLLKFVQNQPSKGTAIPDCFLSPDWGHRHDAPGTGSRYRALSHSYAEFKDPARGTPNALVRTSQSPEPIAVRRRLGEDIAAGLSSRARTVLVGVQGPSPEAKVSIARFRLGLVDETGYLLAGSQRADFPTETERLLLNVATNQAAISMQEARLLSEQKRVAQQLDRKVAQRTRELHAANLELERAVREIHKLQDKLQDENAVLREEVAVAGGGLAPWQVRRAKELMSANLDEQIPLSRLAEECGLSVRHFARAFRQSTGCRPTAGF